MEKILVLLPMVVVSLVFQLGKRKWPWLESLDGLMKQFIILVLCVSATLLYVKLGLPLPEEVRGMQSAALLGLIQGLAALGTHGIKVQASKSLGGG